MSEILFICVANIARSQMAEGFYNHYSKGKAISAGVQDYREKYNFRPYPGVVDVMAEKGIDISEQRIKLVNDELIANSEKIIIFIKENKCPENFKEMLVNHPSVEYLEVEDPCPGELTKENYNEIVEKTRIARDQIERIVVSFMK